MATPDLLKSLKSFRERRERLFKRTNPRMRPLEFAKDAWVLWAAYDLASFPALKKNATEDGRFKKPEEFFDYFRRYAAGKSSLLMVDEDHKYFRDKRGPVALVSVETYAGWRAEVHFDFFHWASTRERLTAAVCALNVMRYSREVGACVVRIGEKDEGFCQHLRDRYGLLQFVGKMDYGRPDGDEFQYAVRMKHAKKMSEKKMSEKKMSEKKMSEKKVDDLKRAA